MELFNVYGYNIFGGLLFYFMLVLGVGILLIFRGLPVVVVGLLTFFLIYCQYANNIS